MIIQCGHRRGHHRRGRHRRGRHRRGRHCRGRHRRPCATTATTTTTTRRGAFAERRRRPGVFVGGGGGPDGLAGRAVTHRSSFEKSTVRNSCGAQHVPLGIYHGNGIIWLSSANSTSTTRNA